MRVRSLEQVMADADFPTRRNVLAIRRLNDLFRTSLSGGTVVVTTGVQALSVNAHAEALKSVVIFSDFTPDNDPHGEHDFGAFTIEGHKLFWKIDYYDARQEYGSPDPANPDVTTRVLTIMLASEY